MFTPIFCNAVLLWATLFNIMLPAKSFSQKNSEEIYYKISFLDSKENQTASQLLEKFKGEILYIDFWATWCAPCLEEFQYHEALQKLAEKYVITLLHISLDREKHEKKWKKRINEYNLTGNHIRANWDLQKDLWKVIFEQESRPSIPRFVLIGKNGEVLNNDVPKPSELEKLEQEFEGINR